MCHQAQLPSRLLPLQMPYVELKKKRNNYEKIICAITEIEYECNLPDFFLFACWFQVFGDKLSATEIIIQHH